MINKKRPNVTNSLAQRSQHKVPFFHRRMRNRQRWRVILQVATTTTTTTTIIRIAVENNVQIDFTWTMPETLLPTELHLHLLAHDKQRLRQELGGDLFGFRLVFVCMPMT